MTARWLLYVWSCLLLTLGCAGGPPPPQAPQGKSSAQSQEVAGGPPRQQAMAENDKAPLVLAGGASNAKSEPGFLAYTDPGDIPHLELAGESKTKLPLEHTHVKAKLTGFVAEVEVAQTYTNPYGKPIEAVYVFPLPENSAVNHMRMVIGKRVIEADVMERQAAKRTYEQAKHAGHTAALLEQERPNVFTQSVANIEPGKKIDVVVRYVQDLTFDDGQYEFVFPMVVGPRFMPGQPLEGPRAGTGTHLDTTRVPDASRVSPPIVGRGERTGHDISLELIADASVAVGSFEVPTHQVVTRRPADGTLRLTLAERKSVPNRDFVLRYRVAGQQPKATLYTARNSKAGGYFSLVLHPPKLDVDRLVGQREIIFVVDVSGSMHGKPLGMCQSAMREALRKLRPVDTFNIITFSGSSQRAFAQPRPANTANVRQAMQVIDGLVAGGGTQMANAVDAALSPPVAQGRHRYVFFLTDGYVGNESEIIASSARFVATLEAKGQRARVFGFGVGSSTNRHLLDGLSRAGKGITVYATTREDPARAVNRFYRYIDRTALTNLKVHWGGMRVKDVYPSEVPDLFASHPVILHGRYSGQPNRLRISGLAGETPVTVPVDVRPARLDGDPDQVMGALWARSKVTALGEDLWDGGDPTRVRAEIIRLGLAHDLVTQYTSLVAVDRSRVIGDGKPDTVVQPVEGPEGVNVEMAGGVRRPRGRGVARKAKSMSSGRLGRLGSGGHRAAPTPPPSPQSAPAPTVQPGQAGMGLGAAAAEEADDETILERSDVAPAAEPPGAYDPSADEGGGGDDSGAGAAQSAPPSDSATDEDAAYASVEPKRGCGCRIAGGNTRSDDGTVAWLALALGALGIGFVRHQGLRRRGHG